VFSTVIYALSFQILENLVIGGAYIFKYDSKAIEVDNPQNLQVLLTTTNNTIFRLIQEMVEWFGSYWGSINVSRSLGRADWAEA